MPSAPSPSLQSGFLVLGMAADNWVQTGGYTDAAAETMLADILIKRRDKIGRGVSLIGQS